MAVGGFLLVFLGNRFPIPVESIYKTLIRGHRKLSMSPLMIRRRYNPANAELGTHEVPVYKILANMQVESRD